MNSVQILWGTAVPVLRKSLFVVRAIDVVFIIDWVYMYTRCIDGIHIFQNKAIH
jgi:hypothetical protein